MEALHVDDDGVRGGGATSGGDGACASELRLAATRCAREVAQGRGESMAITFRDTLTGDVARLQVWRRLRRLFPNVTFAEAESVLDEVLAP